jgi:hypothetical protein
LQQIRHIQILHTPHILTTKWAVLFLQSWSLHLVTRRQACPVSTHFSKYYSFMFTTSTTRWFLFCVLRRQLMWGFPSASVNSVVKTTWQAWIRRCFLTLQSPNKIKMLKEHYPRYVHVASFVATRLYDLWFSVQNVPRELMTSNTKRNLHVSRGKSKVLSVLFTNIFLIHFTPAFICDKNGFYGLHLWVC